MPRPPKPFAPKLFEYTLPGGWIVLAGRTDQDNDHLSLKMAAANDYWFHVRGMAGSHVVLRVPAGEDPDNATIKAAAAIAEVRSALRSRQSETKPTAALFVIRRNRKGWRPVRTMRQTT